LSRLKIASEEANRKLKGLLQDDRYQLMVRKKCDLKLAIKAAGEDLLGENSK
jgi:hypothetical protein